MTKIKVFDINPVVSKAFPEQIVKLGIEVEIVNHPKKTCLDADILITCTTSSSSFIRGNWIVQGMHIAGVGADMSHKRELSPEVYAQASKWVTDLPNQAIITGEIKDAMAQKKISLDSLYGTLGEIVAGKKTGRENDNEITIFKSTGMAIQDVAVAKVVYELALDQAIGLEISITP